MHVYKKKNEDNISSEYNTGETISLPKSPKSFKKKKLEKVQTSLTRLIQGLEFKI